MYDWDANCQPRPILQACAACGVAERYLSRLGLCEGCEADHSAAMAEIDAYEREADDREARARYYGG